MKKLLLFMPIIFAKAKKDVYTKSVTNAFKPIVDILEAILKGMKPFIVMFTVFAVVMQIFKGYQNFQRGASFQKHFYAIIAIIFCGTLMLTYNSWLIPIMKRVAGL